MSPEQLYRNSILSELGNLTWDELCGASVTAKDNFNAFVDMGPKLETGGGAVEGFRLQPTTGSILVLDFASIIQLTEEYYAPGSLGTFNLQAYRFRTTTTTPGCKSSTSSLSRPCSRACS